jgi:aspartyl-tRNA(Asn)/glutamyl-tRNA(Gln) amidotransferase subunit B
MTTQYEAVIGLEIHIQLSTNSKAYSSDSAQYGGLPNNHVSPLSLGHPGTLPMINEKVIEYAVKLGLASGCDIRKENHYARKNYFYADLPKGYQITQDTTPICTGGAVHFKTADGKDHQVKLTRIHMEEDAGKSIHDQDPFNTLIDLNRAGVPLLEMVSEPDIRTSDEAYRFIGAVRKLVRYLQICDGNMEEGSLRCDANISVRPVGTSKFGTKIEVKNMNSMRNVQRAIEFEIDRQTKCILNGEKLTQQTRNFDAVSGITTAMRSKEADNDYRYFPEPDICPLIVTDEYIAEVKSMMPALPDELFNKYTKEFSLSDYDAGAITENRGIALYFEELTTFTNNYKAAANWILGPIKSYLNEKAIDIDNFVLKPKSIANIIEMVNKGVISFSAASQKLFAAYVDQPHKSVEEIVKELNITQQSDSNSIQPYIDKALEKYPDKVQEYRSGKKGLLGLFMGEVMKMSGGKADPKIASKLVKEALDANS